MQLILLLLKVRSESDHEVPDGQMFIMFNSSFIFLKWKNFKIA